MENSVRDRYLTFGLERGFIDRTVDAGEEFIPQFLTNDPSKGEKIITSVKQEMRKCSEFMFSVAFVTWGGVNALLEEFKYLRDRGIRGKILASQYLNFTQPLALKKLKSLGNIDVRIVTDKEMNMHSKCYIFSDGEYCDVIIGSSNLTENALCSNMEWNLRFNSNRGGDVVNDIINEFEKVFEHATPADDIWIEQYSLIYDEEKRIRKALETHDSEKLPKGNFGRISPNKMQAEALANIQKIRDEGKDRALVISATGSGKTFLSAFDAKKYDGKYLYVVHRLPILNKSMNSFEKVMENEKTVGKYDSENDDFDFDCTFCTIQTLSKDRVLKSLSPDAFDYILIDEVHHAGSASYRKVFNHFKPKFMLGMTATPDRTDGFDIYGLFDYNIAYDIRLKQAMEYKLVCPFHYFGISDICVDERHYEDFDTFNDLEDLKRANHVMETAEFYGFDGNRVKGLIFCSRLKEAERYSELFNRNGYRTAWVSGNMDGETVEGYIERLESDDKEWGLDYIFTADLFNEGVDIPAVNQVIMLRPTESPVVYIQQLGRGLRLHRDKNFVVILDFIGNYEKNYNIPLALSDDRSYNKSETRRFLTAGDSIIPGNSTISFDEITKTRIYESIDGSDFKSSKILYEGYVSLKMKMGRIPFLTDFEKYGSVDALNILSSYGSYHAFLSKKEKEYTQTFDAKGERLLTYLSKIAAPGKRASETELLETVMSGTEDPLSEFGSKHPDFTDIEMNNLKAVFDGSFYNTNGKPDYAPNLFEECSKIPDDALREQVTDILELGKQNNLSKYSETYGDTNFVLNAMYTYEDVCRLMNWKANVIGQSIGGYKFDETTNTFSVFINYVKGENVVESQRYEDRFENRRTLTALSKSTEGIESKNMTRVRDSEKNGTKIHLFVRKNKDDKGSKEFYYLGELIFETFLNDEKPVMIRYGLKHEVRSDLFDYFES